jgi:hypothetical protein
MLVFLRITEFLDEIDVGNCGRGESRKLGAWAARKRLGEDGKGRTRRHSGSYRENAPGALEKVESGCDRASEG